MASNHHEFLQTLHAFLKTEILRAQEAQASAYNRGVRATPSFEIPDGKKPGDSVFIIRKNIKTTRPSGKLDYKKLGPFRILERISKNAYKLQLPPTWRIHDVFHVSLLEKAKQTTLRPPEAPTLPIEVEGEQQWEIEAIRRHRGNGTRRRYLVKWKGFPDLENTWEPEENLENAEDVLLAYQEAHT